MVLLNQCIYLYLLTDFLVYNLRLHSFISFNSFCEKRSVGVFIRNMNIIQVFTFIKLIFINVFRIQLFSIKDHETDNILLEVSL